MQTNLLFEKSLKNKKIFISGHTGFTGTWASLWLNTIGAKLAGLSLSPDTSPSIFETTNAGYQVETTIGDICDYELLLGAVSSFQPDIILHLAAQPLVRRSYREPLRTFEVNAQGTANILEVARIVDGVQGVLCITTDKVYKNKNWEWPYRENDVLGGSDPYSSSKSAAEMIINSYSSSYSWRDGSGPVIAVARGGNIIGGGDWSEDRLIPDFVRALVENYPLKLRYPNAIRPWQHVLALVHGYLIILAGLLSDDKEKYARAWNLGPQNTSPYTVRDVLELMSDCWAQPELEYLDNPLPEASSLLLDSTLARNNLLWNPPWDTERVVQETARWYQNYYDDPGSARLITIEQIDAWREGIAE